MSIYPASDLQAWLAEVLRAIGMSADDAQASAARLLLADSFGIHTHGLARFPTYFKQMQVGALKVRPTITAIWKAGLLMVDADRAFGPLAAQRAVEAALAQLSPELAFVPFIICNAGHLGAIGTHVFPAAQAGTATFLSQDTQPVMALPGSHGPAIGNNPIAFAAPRRDAAPFLIDMSNGVVALSHVLNAKRDGLPIPEGWAIDALGHPTTDPAAALAGAMLPAGGHKGIALAMIVQILAGVLSRSRPDETFTSAAPGTGAFGFVLDPYRIAGASYDELMDAWIDRYMASTGDAARIPGERVTASLFQSAQDGIPVSGSLEDELRSVSRDIGVGWPPLPAGD